MASLSSRVLTLSRALEAWLNSTGRWRAYCSAFAANIIDESRFISFGPGPEPGPLTYFPVQDRVTFGQIFVLWTDPKEFHFVYSKKRPGDVTEPPDVWGISLYAEFRGEVEETLLSQGKGRQRGVYIHAKRTRSKNEARIRIRIPHK